MIDKTSLLEYMQDDLYNEIKHMFFYLGAATAVEGLHRKELEEFFLEEAQEEMGHVHEFAEHISFLGGVPDITSHTLSNVTCNDPHELLKEVVRMEEEVASNYATRLVQTEQDSKKGQDAEIRTINLFYEDQLQHSQTAAWEAKKLLARF